MNVVEQFNKEKSDNIAKQESKKSLGIDFIRETADTQYSYNFTWLGRPIIQFPQDMVGLQEILWDVKPDLIVETGIAHGGSLIFSASMLTLLEACGMVTNPMVLGIDINIRSHNKRALESHPLFEKITMFEGSSVDELMIHKVKEFAKSYTNVLVILDSNHTHEHVLSELNAYAKLASVGSYCIVYDTVIEDMPKGSFPNRPWDKGNNPKTAVREFLQKNRDFEIDNSVENKLLITVAYDGFLKRIK